MSNRLRTLRQKLSKSSNPGEDEHRPRLACAKISHPFSKFHHIYDKVPLYFSDSIRILVIHAGDRGDALQCTLTSTRLSDVPGVQYHALSYIWGTRNEARPITVNGQILLILPNLFDFLVRLRRTEEDVVVWADAICINQCDYDEKSQQVKLMHDIYRQAKGTLVWLGEDVPEIAEMFDAYRIGGSEAVRNMLFLKGGYLARRSEVALLEHSYWTRTWILQEVILGRTVTIFAGDQKMVWSDFAALWKTVHGTNNAEENIVSTLNRQRTGSAINKWTLSDLLKHHWRSQCEDRHDRVFGLVGLIDDIDDPLCPIRHKDKSTIDKVLDYNLTLTELYNMLLELYERTDY